MAVSFPLQCVRYSRYGRSRDAPPGAGDRSDQNAIRTVGLGATCGRLLSGRRREKAVCNMASDMHINLFHVTALVARPPAATRRDARLVASNQLYDSILSLRVTAPGEHRGSDGIEEYLTRLQWKGNRTFFDGFDVYWQILNTALPTGFQTDGLRRLASFWRDTGGNFAV